YFRCAGNGLIGAEISLSSWVNRMGRPVSGSFPVRNAQGSLSQSARASRRESVNRRAVGSSSSAPVTRSASGSSPDGLPMPDLLLRADAFAQALRQRGDERLPLSVRL